MCHESGKIDNTIRKVLMKMTAGYNVDFELREMCKIRKSKVNMLLAKVVSRERFI